MNKRYYVTTNDFVRLKKKEKVTVQDLKILEKKLSALFESFKRKYNRLNK